MTLERRGLDAEADLVLGQRLQQALLDHPGLDPQQLLNLVRDLMGEADSLYPALKVLATQASFIELLRHSTGPAARPHLDAVLTFARQTLSPAMVHRLERTLSTAFGLAASPPQVGSEPLPFPVVLQPPPQGGGQSVAGTMLAGAVGDPAADAGTVMATDLRFRTEPVAPQAPSVSRPKTWTALQLLLRQVVLAVTVMLGLYGLLRSPWLCKSFDLCSTELTEPETNKSTEPSAPKTAPKATLKTRLPEPPTQRPIPVRPSAQSPAPSRPSTPVSPVSKPPPANEPLW